MDNYFITLIKYPTYSLSSAFDWALEEYEEDFKAEWGLEDQEHPEHLSVEQWSSMRSIFWLAHKLAEGAATLIRPGKLPEDQLTLIEVIEQEATDQKKAVREILDTLRTRLPEDTWWELYNALNEAHPDDPRTKRDFLNACMEMEAWRLFPSWPDKIASRMEKLVGNMIRLPSEFHQTRNYLVRVAECYVRGLVAEFAVMARAVLECALRDFITDEHVMKLLEIGPPVTLVDRIQAGLKIGIFKDHEFDAANRVREAGNSAAHGKYKEYQDSELILGDLINVLTRIEYFATNNSN